MCGIIERSIYIVFGFFYYGAFEFVYTHFHLFEIPNNWATKIILFVLVDLLWYVYHRSGHVINLFWAAHITHHQSEQYNLTLSFRVSSLQLFIRMFFWMALPLLGFDPVLTTVIIGINAAYQFFIHTRLVNRLGILEEIFVTPSHHRVHHGKNPEYIDKNYGGILIIWDKLFGTFQREQAEVQYGITKPLDSHNPFMAWFHYYIDLYHATKLEEGWRNKLRLLWAGPESLAKYYNYKQSEAFVPRKLSTHMKRYLGTQFAVLCGLCVAMFAWFGPDNYLRYREMFVIVLYVSFSGIIYAAILDNKPRVFPWEVVRVLITGVLIAYSSLIFDRAILVSIGVAYVLTYGVWLFRLKSELKSADALELQKEKHSKASKKEDQEVFLQA